MTNTRNRSQKFNQPSSEAALRHSRSPRLNGKHKVTIRFGAMHNSVELDGHGVVDLNLRNGETLKDNAQRRERVRHDLIQQVFS